MRSGGLFRSGRPGGRAATQAASLPATASATDTPSPLRTVRRESLLRDSSSAASDRTNVCGCRNGSLSTTARTRAENR